jgi:hypothetical protein
MVMFRVLVLALLLSTALPLQSQQQVGGGAPGGGGLHHAMPVHHAAQRQGISNRTIGGDVVIGCKHTATVQTTAVANFQMCVGQTDQDLKNGMSIISVIRARGFLPTCRVLQLLLWMSSEVHENKILSRESFIDVGANIGSCSVAIASLGFPVVSAEPVIEHVNMIKGTLALNPSFHIEVNHVGICVADRKIKVNFGHGASPTYPFSLPPVAPSTHNDVHDFPRQAHATGARRTWTSRRTTPRRSRRNCV